VKNLTFASKNKILCTVDAALIPVKTSCTNMFFYPVTAVIEYLKVGFISPKSQCPKLKQ